MSSFRRSRASGMLVASLAVASGTAAAQNAPLAAVAAPTLPLRSTAPAMAMLRSDTGAAPRSGWASTKPHVLVWMLPVGAGAVAAAALLEQSVQRQAQASRTSGRDDVASVFRQAGSPLVVGAIGGVLGGAGLIGRNDRLLGAGLRVLASAAVAGGAVTVLKVAIGRARPYQELGAGSVKPFSGDASMPSGHTALAFSLATSLSHELHSPVATAALFTVAAGTGWSRINDDQHWLSDVAAGAAIGIVGGELIAHRTKIFGLHPPAFIYAGHAASLYFSRPFRLGGAAH